jgi:hypothetical protein
MAAFDEQQIRQYLLGALAEPERQQLEQRLLGDAAYKELVLMVEDELVEDYVDNILSPAERAQFDRHFLSTPQQREKLRHVSTLQAHLMRAAAPSVPALRQKTWWSAWWARRAQAVPRWQYGPFAVVAVGLALGIWLGGTLVWRHRQEQAKVQQRAALEREIARLNDQRHPPPDLQQLAYIHQVKPAPPSVRGAGSMIRVAIPADSKIVQLRLAPTTEQYHSFRATLTTTEGEELFTTEPLPGIVIDGERAVILNIPASLLSRGDYELKLRAITDAGGLADAGDYFFRISR